MSSKACQERRLALGLSFLLAEGIMLHSRGTIMMNRRARCVSEGGRVDTPNGYSSCAGIREGVAVRPQTLLLDVGVAIDTATPFFKSHTLAQKVRILISSTAPRRPLPFWHTIMHRHTTPEPQPFAPGTKRAAAVARARNDFHGARSLKAAKWVLRRGDRYQSCPAGAGVAVQAAPHRPRPRRPPAEARPGRGGLRRGQVNGIGVRRGK